ncbi:MAG: hypothetical protein KW788_03645 [Candidatus Doudnabacteria bacterium]|nr:hypothetical protein [Candidatus Doudnabacteria bacterium]
MRPNYSGAQHLTRGRSQRDTGLRDAGHRTLEKTGTDRRSKATQPIPELGAGMYISTMLVKNFLKLYW